MAAVLSETVARQCCDRRDEVQVVRRGDDRDMSHVERQLRQAILHVIAMLVELDQCLHGEAVPTM